MRFVFRDRQMDNPIFYKVEIYLEHLLMPKIYVKPNFMKIVRAVLMNVNTYMYVYIYIPIYNFSSFNNKWGSSKDY